MEEQTLHYYLKVFSFIIVILISFFFLHIYYVLNKNVELKNNPISISKGENIETILHNNILNLTNFNLSIIKIFIIMVILTFKMNHH